MSVRIFAARSGKGWEYDIRLCWPEGGRMRERGKCPLAAKTAAHRWAEARERVIANEGKAAYVPLSVKREAPTVESTTPTLATFWPRVVSDHYRANRKKPSTIDAAESIYRLHLAPALGDKPLDTITTADVATLKGALSTRGAKTVNNVLSVLSRALRCAVEWDVIKAVPCRFGLLKVATSERDWYELHEYRRLVDAAAKIGTSHLCMVLLAGSAGLRRGEIRALRWVDVDLQRKQIRLERAIWRKHEDTPKGGRGRVVPMTDELAAALKAARHLKGERVLYSEKGRELSNRTVRNWLARAQRRAGLEDNGGIHILRHTFCSHLAMAGVPAKAIQELAGHADLATTQRYMHLSPSNRSEAMATLARFYTTGPNEGTSPCVTPAVC